MKDIIKDFKPRRVIVDSLSALERVSTIKGFREMRRGITALKMRGSMHDKDIREFNIDGQGMHIGKSFSNVTGILSGHPVFSAPEEIDRVKDLFK
jgi:circadian clock protein KaiC